MLTACLLLACGAARSEDGTAPRGTPVLTRLVHRFLGYENELIAAVQAKDTGRLQGLLSPDFEMRVAPSPGVPVPRESWLAKSFEEAKGEPITIEQMAVHDMGSSAIVSFLGRRKAGGNLFFVDVWKAEADAWTLAVRYVGPSADSSSSIPGWQRNEGTLDKRY